MDYRICVKGQIDSSWQHWCAGLQIRYEASGTTVLSGSLPDQAALYGVLLKIDRLSLTLLAIATSEPAQNETARTASLERGDLP